jgi:nuclear pore complex protein Nup107
MWAFFKSSLDVQVEQELRVNRADKPPTARLSGNVVQPNRSSVELPVDYWNNRKTSEEIFRELEGLLHDYSWTLEEKYHFTVQKFIVCNDIQGLLDFMQKMIDPRAQETLQRDLNFALAPQMLRFFAHVLLFLKSTGFINEHTSDTAKRMFQNIIESYVNYLIDNKHITLVAFYVSKLPKELHTHCYSKLLKKVTDKQERKICLDIANKMGLDVNAITKRVVESMRETNQGNTIDQSCSILDATVFVGSSDGIDASDLQLIQSLEWLSLGQIQFIELMKQSNAFMRNFILSGKLEAAEEVFRRCPSDLISGVRRESKKKHATNELTHELDNGVREFSSFSLFFQARESFGDWTRYYSQSKPRQPIKPAATTRFTDKVAFEHRVKVYELELQQWKEVLKRQAATTRDKILDVITFQGGWMKDSPHSSVLPIRRPEEVSRSQELASLRKTFIPQLTLLLHRVLFTSSLYSDCIQISSVIAWDQHQLQAEFTSEQLSDLLQRIAEASICSLNEGSDAFGHH